MSTTFTENGKQYVIENGHVIEASAADTQEDTTVEFKLKDRVANGKKFGTVISFVPSVYGQSIGVHFDDGSFAEFLPENLTLAPVEKTAAAVSASGFEGEYNDYLEMPTETAEELEEKFAKARELNLRAKALATNGQNPLADQIFYDRVVTATAVDVIDLKEAGMFARASEENYLEKLPKYQMPEVVGGLGGMTRGGDASWLSEAADEIEAVEITDADLVKQASATVAGLDKSQLEDKDFWRQVLTYRLETVPETFHARFAKMINEARLNKIESDGQVNKTASVEKSYDLDGNEIDLDATPFEAIFGV